MAKKERVLTTKEQARVQRTEEILSEWESRGYTAQPHIINIWFAQIASVLVSAPFSILAYFLYKHFGGTFQNWTNTPIESVLFIVISLFSFYVHEVIHWFFMGLCAKSWKDVELGFIWKALTPYCTCQAPLIKWQHFICTIMPMTILGGISTILAIITHNPTILCFAIVHFIGGGGDLLVCLEVFKSKQKDVFIIDHPTECGFYLLSKENKHE